MGVGASVGGLSSPLASARAGGAGAGQRVLSGLDSARLSAPGTINSVRAMALKNHARQENRYISQEGLSSRIRRRGEPRKADDSRSKYRGAGLRTKSGTGTEDGAADSGDEAEAEKNAETSGQTKISKTNTATEIVVDEGVVEGANENCTVPEEKEEEMDEDRDESIAEPSSKASSTLGSLTQFKLNMNLNLKIGLEDDNDWSKVSGSGTACFLDILAVFSVHFDCATLRCRKAARTTTTRSVWLSLTRAWWRWATTTARSLQDRSSRSAVVVRSCSTS
ncbi:hypothetical protein B484DRAFT_161164 [Ochromonadaceae sp. CCMP2298]|nr:hypothetical protein B484DRAFT_161164 [Ochromonadaceae sp. CCMP2298]